MFRVLELIVMEGLCEVLLTLGRAENDCPLFCGDGGGNWPAVSPLPQLGECLRIQRAYLLTGRCMIAVCQHRCLPTGPGEDLITLRDGCTRTDH